MFKLKYEALLGELMLIFAFLSIFNKPIIGLIKIPIFVLLDEVLLVLGLTLLLVFISFSSKVKKVFLLTLGFLLYSILISLWFGLNRSVLEIVLQSLINLKFLILFLAYFWVFKDKLYLLFRFFKVVVIISVLGLILNVILGTAFNELFGLPPFFRHTGFIRYGGFLTPNHMAFLLAMFVGFRLNNLSNKKRKIDYFEWSIIFASCLGIILTDSRSAMFGVAIFLFFYFKDEIFKKARMLLGFGFAAIILIVLFGAFTNLYESILINLRDSLREDSYYIRGIMINLASQISVIFFPLGSGVATFGSKFSDGSPVYEQLGVAHRVFFVEQAGIYDSNVASILGEYGIIGSAFYVYIFIHLKRFLLNFKKLENTRMLNSLFWVFLFYTITNPTLTNNIYILICIPVFAFFSQGSDSEAELETSKS
jgi:hypothetical protein